MVVKWFVDEEYRPQALRLIRDYDRLLAPEIVLVEVASAFLKKRRRGEIASYEIDEAFWRTANLVERYPSAEILREAFVLAQQYGWSVYDSLYVALAVQERCQLVTADERLCNALAPALGETMLWLGDLPAG